MNIWHGASCSGGDGEIRLHFFAGERGASDGRRRVRKNRGIDQCLHWSMQATCVACGHNSNLSNLLRKRSPTDGGGSFSWRRWRDSNSRRAFDPYTISNRARSTNYATSPCCSRMRLLTCQLEQYNTPFSESQGIFSRIAKRIGAGRQI